MNPNEYLPEISLPAPDKSIWIAIAWDGYYYYLLLQNSSLIYQYSCNYECVRKFDAHREYNCLCYDSQLNCFWAASKLIPNTIYKLNRSLQEVDKLCLPLSNSIDGTVKGISYNCECNSLLVAFSEAIISLDRTNKIFLFLNELPGSCITGILSIYPGYIVTQETSRGQFVQIFNGCNCEVDKKFIPSSMWVEQILYDPCHKTSVLYSLVTKKKCHSAIISQCVSSEELDFQINSCYRKSCKQSCPCTKQKETECDDDVSVMQSVALMEAALAHILNTEGEKLQKVLKVTDDMKTIMCVNQQVIETIIHVTHLEILLYDKLSVLQKSCCEQL